MEIIDCFCGIGPWRSRDSLLPYEPDAILRLMDHFGIAKALVYGNTAAERGHAWDGNRYVTDAAAGCGRFVPAFVIAPHAYDDGPKPEDYAKAMREAGARAAWIWPQAAKQGHGTWPWLIDELLSLCQEYSIPLFLHKEGLAPDEINGLCTRHAGLPIVLTGVGYMDDQWLFPLLRQHGRLCVSLGHFYIPPGGPMRFVEHFGAERLLFGSGLPHFSPGGLIGHVTYADLEQHEKEQILGGNLARLLSEVTL